ncbi:MAG: PAS domain S-box protein [Candidatus Krumholzibacteriota bacterium]|nr:PAS domain S-box protein [Candidatus Krumholzibacteriota bacterium]
MLMQLGVTARLLMGAGLALAAILLALLAPPAWAVLTALPAVAILAWALHGHHRDEVLWRDREAELKDSARHADEMIAAIPSGLIGLDRQGRVCRWNEGATRILGMGRGGIVGRHVREWPVAGQRELAARLADALAGRTISRGSLEVTRTDGHIIPLGISTSQLCCENGTASGAVAVFQDLTEVNRIRDRMKQQERLAAVGTLAASIAHEIRNPLASIAGSVEMLAGELDLQGELGELLALILKESDRLNDLIDNFLEFTRDRRPQVAAFAPARLLEEVMTALRQRGEAGSALELALDAAAAPARLEADAAMLKQVFLNLLINAGQAMDWRGRITVTLREVEEAGVRWTDFVVRDGGPGVPPEERPHLFEPFFTTRARGTGLGLAIAHRIAEQHGGSLELLAEPDAGAAFRFRLPTLAAGHCVNESPCPAESPVG